MQAAANTIRLNNRVFVITRFCIALFLLSIKFRKVAPAILSTLTTHLNHARVVPLERTEQQQFL